MPGGGACWTMVIAGIPSELQPFVAKSAVLAPVRGGERRHGDGGPDVWPGERGRALTWTPRHPSSHLAPTAPFSFYLI